MLLVALWLTVCLLLPLPAHLQKGRRFLGPTQVISWHGEELRLLETAPAWMQLKGPIGTACITGDDRVGKSTLLTLWGRSAARTQSFAFTAGHNRSSHTQGLWSTIFPAEVTGLKYHLSLSDSQGLKQVGELQQWRLFSANVLIPSVLIYMVINVVQNDQLRDLARMAHQFLKLSNQEMARFGRSLSPHLVVVVRDESDLDGEDAHDLGAHLEAALSGPGYAKDKELIRQVFKTREAWSLRELPRSARRKLRAGDVPPAGFFETDEVQPYRDSGLAVLRRVQRAVERRIHSLPQGGPDLLEWYGNVLETVNSQEEGSLGRLVGHSERLATTRQRRHLLEEWWSPLYAVFVGTALFGLSGFVGRWLDRIACFAWVALCVFYVGASPLLTTPLHGVIPRLCEQLVGASGGFFARAACQEASAQTVAILLAAALGLLTYPVLTSHVHRLIGMLPLPGRWHRVATALALAVFMNVAWALNNLDLGATLEAGDLSALAARVFLVISIAISGAESLIILQRNRAEMERSRRSRELHYYVAARVPEVAALEASSAWIAHFRFYGQQNSLWRHRLRPFWQPLALFLQAAGFLAWAQLLYPQCDLVLAAGTMTTSFQLLWRCYNAVRSIFRRTGLSDPFPSWFASLEEVGEDLCEEDEYGAGASCAEASCPILEESEEESELRLQIEHMRKLQDPEAAREPNARLGWGVLLFCLAICEVVFILVRQ